jgi:hypothetical protein
MKQLATNYSFDPDFKTVQLTGLNVPVNYILVIINTRRNKVIYNLANPDLGYEEYTQGPNSIIKLKADLTDMEDDDPLTIFYDNGSPSETVLVQGPIGPTGPQGNPGPPGANGSQSLYSTSIANSVQSVAVGGAVPEPASTWKQRTIVQALDTILFPTISAEKTADKSATLTVGNIPSVAADSPANTFEVGRILSNLTLTAALNRGTIKNGDNTTVPLVGPATEYGFSGQVVGSSSWTQSQQSPVYTISSYTVVKTQSSNNPIPTQFQNKWTVNIQHSAGTDQYFDNKGTPQTIQSINLLRVQGSAAGNSSPVLTGVFPWYYLKSPVPFSFSDFVTAIQTNSTSHISAQATLVKNVSNASGTLSIPYNLNNQYLGVAYDKDTTIKTVYWTSIQDTGPISAVFLEPSAPMNPITVPSSTGFTGWTQPYAMLITSSAISNSNPTLELRNS